MPDSDEAMSIDQKEQMLNVLCSTNEPRKKSSTKSKVSKVSSGTKSWFKNFSWTNTADYERPNCNVNVWAQAA